MIEPSLDAPLDVHRATVLPEWIDWNGHMNVGFYVVAFDKATDTLCQQFGCSWEYTREKIGMTFVIEAHVTYDREVKEGDPLRITSQILDLDAKRLHVIHCMHHGTEGYLAATNELMLMNIDYQSRRSAPWPDWAMERIDRLAEAEQLASLRPELDGQQIMAVLGIGPGPVVGRAYAHLLQVRLDAGLIGEEHARAELLDWWRRQPESTGA
jgi:acyl-CoA thioester hydrolase